MRRRGAGTSARRRARRGRDADAWSCPHAPQLVHREIVRVLGKVLPDARQIVNGRDAVRIQVIRRTDTREHQDLRRVVAAGESRTSREACAWCASRAAGTRRRPREPCRGECGGSVRPSGCEGSAARGRTQIGARGARAPPVADGRLHPADAFLARAVRVVIERNAGERAASTSGSNSMSAKSTGVTRIGPSPP